jgi:sulfonate transport system substrate-binding protein
VRVGLRRQGPGRWWKAAAALAWLLMAGALARPAAAEGPPERLRVAYAAIGGAMANLWVAKEAGAFAKQGLDVELIYLGSGPKAMAGLIAGDTPFVQGSGEAMVVARLAGRDVVGIAETIHTFVFSLMVSPAIAGPEDLRGKVLGMTKAASSTDFALHVALQRLGLQPGRDVQVLAVGGVPEILAGIEGGKLHGGILSPPTVTLAKRRGLRELLDLSPLGVPFQQAGVVASRAYLQAHPETTRKFLRGYLEGIAVMKQRRDFTLQVIRQYTKVDDPEVLAEAYEAYARRTVRRVPYPTVASVRTVLERLGEGDPRARAAKPEDFIDPGYLREIEESGFVKALYAGGLRGKD